MNVAWFDQIEKQLKRRKGHLLMNLSSFWITSLFYVGADDSPTKSLHLKYTNTVLDQSVIKELIRVDVTRTKNLLVAYKHHLTTICMKRIIIPSLMPIERANYAS